MMAYTVSLEVTQKYANHNTVFNSMPASIVERYIKIANFNLIREWGK